MALVSYDYDSASGGEDEEEAGSAPFIIIPAKPKTEENTSTSKPTNSDVESVPADPLNSIVDDDVSEGSSLFSKLPETKPSFVEVVEDKIEDFVPKSKPVKEKQKVKITIPSLSEFQSLDDDDEPEIKKVKSSDKGSSLLSLLPPVKGSVMTTKSFVPHSVAKKNKNTKKPAATSSLVPHAVRKNAEAKKKAALKKINKPKAQDGSDIESDDDIDLPETYDDEMWEKVCGRPKPKEVIKEPEEITPMEVINIAPEPEKPYEGLDNSAFKELVGKSKRPIGNIKLIDINEEEILLEKDLWMTKALTDPELESKKEEEEPVDPTRRKRHHITYLAQQAKANEQDLKSQWGASRNNRLQTRAKYGF